MSTTTEPSTSANDANELRAANLLKAAELAGLEATPDDDFHEAKSFFLEAMELMRGYSPMAEQYCVAEGRGAEPGAVLLFELEEDPYPLPSTGDHVCVADELLALAESRVVLRVYAFEEFDSEAPADMNCKLVDVENGNWIMRGARDLVAAARVFDAIPAAGGAAAQEAVA